MADEPQYPLARPVEPPRPRMIGVRIITLEKARQFAETLLSDVSHSVESASMAVGLKPSAVRKALERAHHDKCATLDDEEVCEILYAAKLSHIRNIRERGFVLELDGKRTSWSQWQLEVQAPLEHPRGQSVALEMSGKDGGAIETASTTVTYLVMVPEEEPEDG